MSSKNKNSPKILRSSSQPFSAVGDDLLEKTLCRRNLFSSVLKGLNLLVDTKAVRGDGLEVKGGYRVLNIKVRKHDGNDFLHIVKYMLKSLRLSFHVKNSHLYTVLKTRAEKSYIDQFACASSVMIGYLETLSNFDDGFNHKFTVPQLLSGWDTLINQNGYENYAKLVKFMCAYPLSRTIHNDPPPLVEGYNGSPLVFRGRLASYIRQRIIVLSNKNKRLMFSILNLKRCSLKMPSEYIYGALKKHRELMEKPCPDVSPSYVFDFKERLGIVLDRLNIDKFECFSKFQQFASSASYRFSREKGGASGEMRSIASGEQSYRMPVEFPSSRSDLPNFGNYSLHEAPGQFSLDSMSYTPNQGVRSYYQTYDWKGQNVFTFINRPDIRPEVVKYQPDQVDIDHLASQLNCDDVDECLLSDDFQKLCHARVAAVEEPLKIRTVTCGDVVPYSLCTGLQKDLHSSLKKFPQFALIGEEISSKHLDWLFQTDPILCCDRIPNHERLVDRLEGYGFVSGDYTSATDTLNLTLSKLIIEGIVLRGKAFHGWKDEYCNLIKSTIYEHVISYPKCRNEAGKKLPEIPDVLQTNGQLMGSILSFPLLCIINFIHYWISVEPEFHMDDLPVLVNGDDILFFTQESKYINWRDTLDQPGFQLSLGKNYYSNRIFTINTTMYESCFADSYDNGHSFNKFSYVHCPYFPAGKLLGKSKVESPYHPRFKPVWALQADVIQGAQNAVRAWDRFNFYHQKLLKKVSFGGKYNWYVSPYLGGLGMILPEGVTIFTDKKKFNEAKCAKTFITKTQHQMASFMYRYKRNWYYDKFHSGNFGLKNDNDKFYCPHHLKDRLIAPVSESFEPDVWSCIRLPMEPMDQYEMKSIEPGNRRLNIVHSRGKYHDDSAFSYYDTDVPEHAFRYVRELISPDILCRTTFTRVFQINRIQIPEVIKRFNRIYRLNCVNLLEIFNHIAPHVDANWFMDTSFDSLPTRWKEWEKILLLLADTAYDDEAERLYRSHLEQMAHDCEHQFCESITSEF